MIHGVQVVIQCATFEASLMGLSIAYFDSAAHIMGGISFDFACKIASCATTQAIFKHTGQIHIFILNLDLSCRKRGSIRCTPFLMNALRGDHDTPCYQFVAASRGVGRVKNALYLTACLVALPL